MADVAERIYRNQGNPPLLELLPSGPGRVLDCGCGAGDNARLLRERGWRVTGVTLSAQEREAATAHCELVLVADLEEGLPEAVGAGYDAVLLSHVLEHLVHPESVLEAARRVLKGSGVLAVALPNVLFYPLRLQALFGRFEYTRDGIMDETHVRFYTFASGAALLCRSGYRIVAATAEGGFPLWRLRDLLPPALVNRLNRLACRLRPGLFGRQCLYLARPEPPAGP